jgi:quercetin dioxygenase-like cupin family protein
MIRLRDFGVGAAAGAAMASAAAIHAQSGTSGAPSAAQMGSTVFTWESVAATPTKVGAVRRFFRSPTPTLDELEYHVTTLNPGQSPHPPHQHPNEEIIIVKEGAVEAYLNGGWTPVSTGSLIFNASNQPHTVRNVGTVPATYFVINWSSPGMLKKAAAPDVDLRVEPIDSPASAGSAQPQLTATDDGVTLSWIEERGRTSSLKFAELSGDRWSAPRAASSGTDWFVNWADVPSVIRLPDGTLAAHWLQKSGSDTYAYDVRLSFSRDDGKSWTPSTTPHHDGTETEHGFASLFPIDGGLGLVWLDGREMKGKQGAMTLRAATFDGSGKQVSEALVDERVCECCPTAVAVTDAGPIAAFRDRSADEVRDIHVSRLENGRWSTPSRVHADGWKIPMCPVNGPALSARGRNVAIAWFTVEGEEGRAFAAFSSDAGRSFGQPIRLDDVASLGRVDVELLDDGSAVAAWIEAAGGRNQFRIRRIRTDGQKSPAQTIAAMASGRTGGYPRMARTRDALVLAWTENEAGVARVRTARAKLNGGLGWFDQAADVGAPKIKGSTTYDAGSQAYTVVGAGTNMWAQRDEFHMVSRRLTGDFVVRTHAKFLGAGTDPHRKLGLIVRKDLAAESAYVDAAVHGDGLTSLQFRRAAGGATEEARSTVTAADVIQLERRGTTYTMSVARFGEPFTRTEVSEIDLGDEVHVGLFVCSHNPDVSERALFHNVRIVVPPRAGWVPYRDYIGSNLEVISVETGERTVLHSEPVSLQAPNWANDGRSLIYNSGGRLYRFDLSTRKAMVIDTGLATANNNDHVLSFDGRMLGISHHSKEDGNRSVIYTLPAEGGTPKRVTPSSPSYLHGWSPDARHLLYTGQRGDELDIYKIPVDGGEEVRLTTAPGVDDGSEYSPDGQWIYFNSSRTGRMQIWRMRPDGSGQEQITSDEYNNWFPHVSPDGRLLAVLSYGDDVKPDDHPFYKHVYLRLMRPDGSSPRILAYVYGGQGTINVPSWSPDSKRLAFVSNTALPAPVQP